MTRITYTTQPGCSYPGSSRVRGDTNEKRTPLNRVRLYPGTKPGNALSTAQVTEKPFPLSYKQTNLMNRPHRRTFLSRNPNSAQTVKERNTKKTSCQLVVSWREAFFHYHFFFGSKREIHHTQPAAGHSFPRNVQIPPSCRQSRSGQALRIRERDSVSAFSSGFRSGPA